MHFTYNFPSLSKREKERGIVISSNLLFSCEGPKESISLSFETNNIVGNFTNVVLKCGRFLQNYLLIVLFSTASVKNFCRNGPKPVESTCRDPVRPEILQISRKHNACKVKIFRKNISTKMQIIIFNRGASDRWQIYYNLTIFAKITPNLHQNSHSTRRPVISNTVCSWIQQGNYRTWITNKICISGNHILNSRNSPLDIGEKMNVTQVGHINGLLLKQSFKVASPQL